jgi:hypothetical protein
MTRGTKVCRRDDDSSLPHTRRTSGCKKEQQQQQHANIAPVRSFSKTRLPQHQHYDINHEQPSASHSHTRRITAMNDAMVASPTRKKSPTPCKKKRRLPRSRSVSPTPTPHIWHFTFMMITIMRLCLNAGCFDSIQFQNLFKFQNRCYYGNRLHTQIIISRFDEPPWQHVKQKCNRPFCLSRLQESTQVRRVIREAAPYIRRCP